MVNRLRWHLHRIAPGQAPADPAPKTLNQGGVRQRLADWLQERMGIDARLAREVLADIDRICPQIAALEHEIAALVAADPIGEQLTQLPGCGALTAAKILGETAGVERFADEAKFAMHAGVAPIPVWSGRTQGRVRVSRTGNRQLNAALHRIAVTQLRVTSPQDVLRQAPRRWRHPHRGHPHDVKRRLARTVFNILETNPSTTAGALPAAA